MCLGFLAVPPTVVALGALFALAGLYIAIVDAMERALAADLLPLANRGAGYGALATVNSFGDLLSSIVVGLLWTRVSIAAGFAYAAVLTFAGSAALVFAPTGRTPQGPSTDEQGIPDSSTRAVSQ
jgi:MFS family permease